MANAVTLLFWSPFSLVYCLVVMLWWTFIIVLLVIYILKMVFILSKKMELYN